MLESIADRKVDPKLNKKVLAIIIHSLWAGPLRAVHDSELANGMWDRMQDQYEWNTVIRILTLTNNVHDMRYRGGQNVGDHNAIVKSKFAQLAFLSTELRDSTKLAILIATLKDCSEFEPLIMSMGIMKEDNHSGKQVTLLFVEETERLQD